MQPWSKGYAQDDDSSSSSSGGSRGEDNGSDREDGEEEGSDTPEAEVVEDEPEMVSDDRPTDEAEFTVLGDSPNEESGTEEGGEEEKDGEEGDIVVEVTAKKPEAARLRGSGPPEGWTSDQSVLDTPGDEMHPDEAPSDAEDTPEGVHRLLTKAAIRAINREELKMAGLPIAEEIPPGPDLDIEEVCVAVKESSVGQACYAYREIAGQPLNETEVAYTEDPKVRTRAERAFQQTRRERGLFSEEELEAQGVEAAQCDDMKDGIYRLRGGGRSKRKGGRPRKIDDSITKEMRALQKHGENLVPKASIRRLVRLELNNAVAERGLLGRWVVHYEAHTAIHDALENFATELFQDAVLATIHAKRRTTQLEDLKLAGQLTGLAKRPDRDAYQADPNPKAERKRIVWKDGKK
jgi:histone H3/H4